MSCSQKHVLSDLWQLDSMFKRSLLVLATVGVTILANNAEMTAHNHDPTSEPHSHTSKDPHHQMREISAGEPIPTVKLVVHPDTMRGYNLEVQTTNFKFAPEEVNKAAKPGEGHAHLYVNGKKITRLYSSWYYLDNLKPGKNEIRVSLNANNHQVLAHNGKMIEATQIVEVPATKK
ncbi:MAG: hypothetical protein CLLPBCKN_003510 [Chroococcidiopsis cubana SAG 39.79]|jgi:hypothetical protein|uniref:Uncharacterized protein n=2 Tax=Chroococcidiopsis TaxID=54298 RepID=K9TWS4_CHRTP|nr:MULTISPECIES: hypothetical protein [Chroococcidiopsis]AFY86828.1 hypothetical protein Chro_1302 [Chroococcidiopsis thermalis PCC 7203]MDZ4874114.1 hypothetical protein [Chroococcidiopsis cubana SAG 39.79]RUT12264.1 hypothetical protein DSM107010_24780 [Chroococcidiopsis cubana SAG 39.79]URD51685.1 hypothetical protein M5J74_06755 [Chroococcidiopsis sp. CCNUC1]